MKKVLFALLLAAAALAVYWFMFKHEDQPEQPKQKALESKNHSQGFNKSVDSLLEYYFTIKNAFVDGDSLKAKQAGMALVSFLKVLNMDELKKDTTGIYESAAVFTGDIIRNAESMGQSQTLTDMRHDFKDMSENIYPFLKTVHYNGSTLYWQNCGMPFGENTSANWISNTAEVVNPYLGKNHPVYKSGMLHCGEVLDSITAR